MLARTVLRCDPRSVRRARRFVAKALLAGDVPAELVDTAVLLVSELASNVILHARSGIEVSVACRPDHARVAVADRNPRHLVRRRHAQDATTGRGLLLVDRLAATWGVEPAPDGKTVWFELRPPAGDAAADPDLEHFLDLESAAGQAS